MAKLSLKTNTMVVKRDLLITETNIAKQEAEREAQTKRIMMVQQNEQKTLQAQAEFDATSILNKAKIASNDVEIKNQQSKLNLEIENKQKLLDLDKQRGELFKNYPELYKLYVAELQSASMKGIQSTIISPEVANGLFGSMFQLRQDLLPKTSK